MQTVLESKIKDPVLNDLYNNVNECSKVASSIVSSNDINNDLENLAKAQYNFENKLRKKDPFLYSIIPAILFFNIFAVFVYAFAFSYFGEKKEVKYIDHIKTKKDLKELADQYQNYSNFNKYAAFAVLAFIASVTLVALQFFGVVDFINIIGRQGSFAIIAFVGLAGVISTLVSLVKATLFNKVASEIMSISESVEGKMKNVLRNGPQGFYAQQGYQQNAQLLGSGRGLNQYRPRPFSTPYPAVLQTEKSYYQSPQFGPSSSPSNFTPSDQFNQPTEENPQNRVSNFDQSQANNQAFLTSEEPRLENDNLSEVEGEGYNNINGEGQSQNLSSSGIEHFDQVEQGSLLETSVDNNSAEQQATTTPKVKTTTIIVK
jgi:hypothetical protein